MAKTMHRSTIRSLTIFLLVLVTASTASIVTVQIAPSAALDPQQSGLLLTVASNLSSYIPGEVVSITGTLSNNGASVPSALVSIQVSKPSGAALFVDMPTTNGAGQFSTSFTLSQSADLGTYTVYAVYSTANAQRTFQVNPLPPPPPPPSGSDTITVNTNPSGLDSPQGGGAYTNGQQITISISDVSGYTFIKWQRDGSDWTTQKSFQYTVDAPRTFTAIFQQVITTTSSSTTSSTSSTSSTTQTTSTVATSSSSSSSSATSSTSPTNTGLSIVLGSAHLTTTAGGTVSFPVTVSSPSPQPAQVALSMNGLQATWQYTFFPQSGTANPTFVSTLTLKTSSAAPPGSYITTVRATDQSGHFVEGNAIIVVAQTTVTQATVTQAATTTTPPVPTLSAKCIIATAAYGSEMAPEVAYMRYVRDNLIGSTPTGKVLRDAFNTFYYSWSPPIAQAIAGNAGLQALFRILLLPLVGIIHAAAWVFITLGAGDLASIAAFTLAAALTITVYIVTPTFAIFLTYKESKALLISPSDST